MTDTNEGATAVAAEEQGESTGQPPREPGSDQPKATGPESVPQPGDPPPQGFTPPRPAPGWRENVVYQGNVPVNVPGAQQPFPPPLYPPHPMQGPAHYYPNQPPYDPTRPSAGMSPSVPRASSEFGGVERGFEPDPNRDRPLSGQATADHQFLEITRTAVGRNSPEDAEGGWCGNVRDMVGYKGEVQRRWGGGDYLAEGKYNGQKVKETFTIPGPSKPTSPKDKDDDEDDEDYEGFSTPFVRRAPPWGGFRAPFSSPGVYPTGSAYGGHSGVYGSSLPITPSSSGVGYRPWGMPGGGAPPFPTPVQSELEELKESLEEAKEAAAKEREERRIEQIKAEARAEREAFERRLESMQREMQNLAANRGGGSMDKMIEVMTLQIQQEQLRQDRERQERERRAESERAERKQDLERREAEWRKDQERLQSERQASLDRMDREREKQDNFFKQMFSWQTKQQKDPVELLAQLNALNPKRDISDDVSKFAMAFAAIKDAFSDGNKDQSQVESIIEKGGEALTSAIEAFKGQNNQQSVDPNYMLAAQQQQHGSLPGPTPEQYRLAQLQAYQAQLSQAEAQVQVQAQAQQQIQNDPNRPNTGEEWGRILDHVLEAFLEEREAEEYVDDMYRYVVGELRRPQTFDVLEQATAFTLKIQLPKIKRDIPVSSDYYGKVEAFEKIVADEEEGKPWVEDLLDAIRVRQNALRDRARALQQQAMQQQAMPQQGYQNAPPSAPGPDGYAPGYPPGYAAQAYGPQLPQPVPMDPKIAAMQQQAMAYRPNAAQPPQQAAHPTAMQSDQPAFAPATGAAPAATVSEPTPGNSPVDPQDG